MKNNKLKLVKQGEVRVRFAPSPTGFLHIGSVRTALFNHLFAKAQNGSFVLRIEDTDKERSKEKYEKDIMRSLKWLGIEWDEGPDTEGKRGPYRQSERLKIYTKYLEKLLEEKKAYYCFCSEEELEAQRQYLMSIGESPHYNGKCADLSEKEVKKYLKEGKPAVIRFKVAAKKLKFSDLVRGEIEFDTSLIGDIAIAKNLESPLYNLAVVIDDFEMGITHVIRGEEHISNTPKQILLQEALNIPQPKYAHIPMILAPNRTKLSKRYGAVGISDYKKDGYLPEAIVNFIAFLGWNPGTEREIYSLPSLIKEFSLEKVQKGGAVFDIKKLDFLNGFYIRQKSTEKLTELCIPYFKEEGLIEPIAEKKLNNRYKEKIIAKNYRVVETKEEISFDYLKEIVEAYKTRIKKLSEIAKLADFIFKDKLDYSKKLLSWQNMTDEDLKTSLGESEKILSKIKIGDWNVKNLENILITEAEKFSKKINKPDQGRGYLLWPLRVALSGKEASASPFEIAKILGKEKTIKRIKGAERLIK